MTEIFKKFKYSLLSLFIGLITSLLDYHVNHEIHKTQTIFQSEIKKSYDKLTDIDNILKQKDAKLEQ